MNQLSPKKQNPIFPITFINLKAEFTQNVLTLMSATLIAQAINVVISPILTRLYSPVDFGVLSVFMATCNFLGIIITGKYDNAIVLPAKDEDAINVFALSMLITAIVSIVVLLSIFIFNDLLSGLSATADLSEWLYFIPLLLLFTGLYQSLVYWFSRHKDFKGLAVGNVSQSVSSSLVRLFLGVLKVSFNGLITGLLFGQAFASFLLSFIMWKRYRFMSNAVSSKRIIDNAKKYIDFPKYNAPQGFMDMVRESGLIFIISYYFGLDILGYYSLATTVVSMPLSLIGASAGQVFFQKATEHYNSNQSIWSITKQVMIKLGLIGLPIYLILAVIGPILFSYIFGSKWKEAGIYAQIMTPWLYVKFITSPVSILPMILNEQKNFFFIGAGISILTPGIFLLMSYNDYSFKTSLLVLSFFTALYLLGIVLWIYTICKSQLQNSQ